MGQFTGLPSIQTHNQQLYILGIPMFFMVKEDKKTHAVFYKEELEKAKIIIQKLRNRLQLIKAIGDEGFI